ncbi:probable low-specificity L-threonine aldolase 1 [Gigantopelta aegis]|uniref:probable low-specificity L-threonine aldolase 1 n=1 Tax=Gigantopelta aegis TaxID=1735272 RepID=UPI001B889D0B|nr:probable low-specificity L-threonine aldolase 1 [Gigantopelta aegis]
MAAANKVIDMRSDTVTTPTQKMKEAMMQAKVGDDVYGEDPTVILLQNKIAGLLKKESALYFPSGTMSNLVGIMAHANTRGDEVILGDRSHIAIWEQGSISQVGGVFARQVKNLDDGTLDLDDLQSKSIKVVLMVTIVILVQ